MALMYLDAYLIVLIAVQQIAGKNLIVKRPILIDSLRRSIKILYAQRILSHVQSCIDDILETAVSRYEEMGLI